MPNLDEAVEYFTLPSREGKNQATKHRYIKLLETRQGLLKAGCFQAMRVGHDATDGIMGEQANRRDDYCGGSGVWRRGTRAVVRRRALKFLRQHLHRLSL